VAQAHLYKIIETISIVTVTKYPIFIGIVQALNFLKFKEKAPA